MKPIISLIGRPNVGKSTLFNLLIRKRDSLVLDYPKLTRDRKYGYAKIFGISCTLIDTGGIDFCKQSISLEIFDQSILAIKESNIILFILDGRSGLNEDDILINNFLRKFFQKNIFFVVNKIEGLQLNLVINEFYKLGMKKIYTISSTNNIGIQDLFLIVLHPWIKNTTLLNQTKLPPFLNLKKEIKKNIQITVVGLQNVGKSTLINNFIQKKYLISSNDPGLTRENIYIKTQYKKKLFTIIDTAGIKKYKKNNKSSFIDQLSISKTYQAIKESDISILLIDANSINVSRKEIFLINFILEKGNILLVVINKFDSISLKERDKIKKIFFTRLKFINFIDIFFISSNNKKQVKSLFNYCFNYYSLKTTKISTNTLNKIMYTAISEYIPSFFKKKKIKLKFVHIGNYNPFSIIIHGNNLNKIPKNYISYLTNYFYRSLKIKGFMLKIYFKK